MDRPPEAEALYAELLRLTEEMRAAALARDDAAVAELAGRRDIVMDALPRASVPPTAAAGIAEIIRRVLDLDAEVTALLRTRSEGTRKTLEAIAARRRSLQSYRSGPPVDPLFIERLG